jgi:hypothetical protein
MPEAKITYPEQQEIIEYYEGRTVEGLPFLYTKTYAIEAESSILAKSIVGWYSSLDGGDSFYIERRDDGLYYNSGEHACEQGFATPEPLLPWLVYESGNHWLVEMITTAAR